MCTGTDHCRKRWYRTRQTVAGTSNPTSSVIVRITPTGRSVVPSSASFRVCKTWCGLMMETRVMVLMVPLGWTAPTAWTAWTSTRVLTVIPNSSPGRAAASFCKQSCLAVKDSYSHRNRPTWLIKQYSRAIHLIPDRTRSPESLVSTDDPRFATEASLGRRFLLRGRGSAASGLNEPRSHRHTLVEDCAPAGLRCV